jgi:hypothetical protein
MGLNLWILRMLNMAPREPAKEEKPATPYIDTIERFMQDQKQKTVRVRIAVAVLESGKWQACGGHNNNDKQSSEAALRNTADYTNRNRIVHFIEAEVPVPESYTIKAD